MAATIKQTPLLMIKVLCLFTTLLVFPIMISSSTKISLDDYVFIHIDGVALKFESVNKSKDLSILSKPI